MNRPVHTIVVAYGGGDLVDRCLTSVNDRVTVVDNSSSPEVRAAAERRGAEYIDPGKNLGFAAGVNVGLRPLLNGPATDVLLLNPDATIAPEAVASLVEHLHAPGNERLAAVAPRLVRPDGSVQRVLWPFPSPRRAWSEAVGLGRLGASRDTFAIGAVLLLRWEAILDVGLFDERFFLYAEEADWQRRARTGGWYSTLDPDVTAEHLGAGSSGGGAQRESLFHAAQETYIRKWYGRFGWESYRFAACLGALGRAVVLTGDRRTAAARRARFYARGPRRGALLD